jgi:hypothetical protein
VGVCLGTVVLCIGGIRIPFDIRNVLLYDKQIGTRIAKVV